MTLYGGTSEALRVINTGNVGLGTTIPGARLEVADTSTLASESLTNPNLTAGTSWTQTGDIALADAANYNHVTGVGTLTQASGVMAIAGKPNRLYSFTYTISDRTTGGQTSVGTVTMTVTSSLPTAVNDTINVTREAYTMRDSRSLPR